MATDGPNDVKRKNNSEAGPLLLNPGLYWDRCIEQRMNLFIFPEVCLVHVNYRNLKFTTGMSK